MTLEAIINAVNYKALILGAEMSGNWEAEFSNALTSESSLPLGSFMMS